MDEGAERDSVKDALPESDTLHEGVVYEGLRLPLTLEQRRRRAAITALAIAVTLAVFLWPTVSQHISLSAIRPIPLATATQSGFTSYSQFEITIVNGSSSSVPSAQCPVTPQSPSTVGAPELHADSIGNGDVWALLLSCAHIGAGQDTNIVWRATGSGAFSVTANGPDNMSMGPTFPPNPHGGSTWERPGDEWGTIFNFPKAGCWQLQVSRGADLRASLWLSVGA